LDRIQIGYCLYHIRIRIQPSDTDTDIGECEKLISVSVKIGYQILADRMRILIEHVKMDTVKDKLNGYTYITFYLIYNNIKCDTYYDIDRSLILHIYYHILIFIINKSCYLVLFSFNNVHAHY